MASPRFFPLRHGARRSGALLLASLLACTLVLATMLAYEAHEAAASHRATAERALHDYAAVAAWAFNVRKRLLGAPPASVPSGTKLSVMLPGFGQT